jgi:hypothetical protein
LEAEEALIKSEKRLASLTLLLHDIAGIGSAPQYVFLHDGNKVAVSCIARSYGKTPLL